MRPFVIPLLLLTLFGLPACEKKKEPGTDTFPSTRSPRAPEPPAPVELLAAPIEPVIVETAADALPAWRSAAPLQPTLVLFANYPFLQPIPPQLQQKAVALVRDGDSSRLRLAVDSRRPDPLLLPEMALDAALRSGFFSRVLWVLPSEEPKEKFSLEVFTRQLIAAGAIETAEAATFTLADGVYSGTVRGLPFQAAPLALLPKTSGTVVLHFDLGYFQPLYKGEIKTGLYGLLQSTLKAVQAHHWPAAAATISLSNIGGGLPLETRFLGHDLAAAFRSPGIIDGVLPAQWDLRGKTLYLENFFQKEMILDLLRQMETADPKDPSVKFALYHLHRQMKDGDEAMALLAEAVALDATYALEYLTLAEVAEEKKLPQKKVEVLEKAAAVWPQDPFARLSLVLALLDAGERQRAGKIIAQLRREPWSPIYYPGMPAELERLAAEVEKD